MSLFPALSLKIESNRKSAFFLELIIPMSDFILIKPIKILREQSPILALGRNKFQKPLVALLVPIVHRALGNGYPPPLALLRTLDPLVLPDVPRHPLRDHLPIMLSDPDGLHEPDVLVLLPLGQLEGGSPAFLHDHLVLHDLMAVCEPFSLRLDAVFLAVFAQAVEGGHVRR